MKLTLEPAYWSALCASLIKPSVPVTRYIPASRQAPSRGLQTLSAWEGIENILADLIDRFDLGTERCLEFGVEYGFSTVALSSYFRQVTGVDTFTGDEHTSSKEDIYEQTCERLAGYDNIRLIRSDYRDYIATDDTFYDLIHVDIVHTYADTLACGLWAARHSRCAIFHDTQSFPAVKQAIRTIARTTGKATYNFEESNGLGIVV